MNLKKALAGTFKDLLDSLRPGRRSHTFRHAIYFLAAVACLVNTVQAAVEQRFFRTTLGAVSTVFLVIWLILDIIDRRLEAKDAEVQASIAQLAHTTGEALDLRAPRSPFPFKEPAKSSPPN